VDQHCPDRHRVAWDFNFQAGYHVWSYHVIW
jgi:hypothetical protein